MVHDTSGAFPCNTCSLTFKSSVLQRNHMRTAWHVNNLQRKISGQPALSQAEFEECMEKNVTGRRKKSRHNDYSLDISERDTALETSSESDGHASETSNSDAQGKEQSANSSKQTDDSLSPIEDSTRCLFCAAISPNTQENISHMSSAHSFFLPSASASTAAVEPLLSYLSILIYTYHECIYCAQEKYSVHGVQSHMRDKAHCKLDVSLYEDFFYSEEDVDTQEEEEGNATGAESDEGTQEKTRHSINGSVEGAKKSSSRKARKEKAQHSKSHLPHTGSKTSPSQQQSAATNTTSLQTTTSQNLSLARSTPSSHVPPLPLPPAPSNGRNSALSLAGLSNSQLISLAGLDKKMRRQEVSAQKRVGHLALRQPVKAIYYKTENPVYQAG